MKCNIEKTKLHLFYDDQLGEEESQFLINHIKDCKDCNKEIEYLSLLQSQFSEMKNIKIKDDLFLRLIQIKKKNYSLFELLKDIFKITLRNNTIRFHIDSSAEVLLREKYSNNILRWVFFC